MEIVVRTAVQAYTPGQIINAEIALTNDSDKSIVKFSVELIRVGDLFLHSQMKPG